MGMGGFRWNPEPPEVRLLHNRIQSRFRFYVKRRGNPEAPIERQPCQFCGAPAENSEFHHPDYTRPFYGAWACMSCHRKIDHGSLEVMPAQMNDYEPLVKSKLRTFRWREEQDKLAAFDFGFNQQTG